MPTIVRETPEYLEFMDDISPITLDYFTTSVRTDQWTWETPVQKRITELTGVTLSGTYSTDADGNTLTLMIASGDKLPDIISGVGAASVQMRELREGNCIYPLNELIDKYCPLYWSLLDPYYESKKDKNGDLWYFPRGYVSLRCNELYSIGNGWDGVRTDIAEALGYKYEDIKTYDDMWKVLDSWSQNKEKWPEIKYPIFIPSMSYEMPTPNGRPFYNGYGGKLCYTAGFDMIYDHASDSVHYWIEDEFGFKALKEMFKLAQAGYITEDSFTIGEIVDELNTGSILFYTGQNAAGFGLATDLQNNVPGAVYKRLGILSYSPDYTAGYYGISGGDWGSGLVVPRDCKNPERTIKFLEFLHTEFGGALMFFGIYGEHFEIKTDPANGKAYPSWIGGVTDENKLDFGIENYKQECWMNNYADYTVISMYQTSIKEPDVMYASSLGVQNVYDVLPWYAADKMEAGSEISILRNQLESIMMSYQPRMILAKDEAEFQHLYDECLTRLENSGLQRFKDAVLPLTKEVLAEKEAQGIKFH